MASERYSDLRCTWHTRTHCKQKLMMLRLFFFFFFTFSDNVNQINLFLKELKAF